MQPTVRLTGTAQRATLTAIVALLPTDIASLNWSIYHNKLYRYSIRTPPEWPRGAEIAGGRGVELYSNNSDVTISIRVYDSNEESAPMLGGDQKSLILLRVRTQKIQLNNGDTAFLQLQREGHTIFYALEAWVDGTPIWLQARMPDTFFYQNEHVLLSVIKSLEIPGSIENRIYDIEQNHPEPVITALLPGTTIHNWRTYSNYSYGYSILYPADWPISADYDAHDGRVLYIGNPDFDVRITGMFDQYEPSWDSHIKGAKEQIITLDNGESAHLFITKRYGQIVYHVVWVRPRILCWFTAEMSETLYAQQQDTIEAMARSLSSEPSWIDRR